MSDNRLTARFSDEEFRRIEAHAAALGVTKTEVLRFGVKALSSSEQLTGRLAEIREQLGDDMRAEMAARMAKLTEQNRKTATLLLLVMKAPDEAKQTLTEIFKD